MEKCSGLKSHLLPYHPEGVTSPACEEDGTKLHLSVFLSDIYLRDLFAPLLMTALAIQ
jgi:hypothetical protein